ncbi:MAG: 50S ribosomal protein L18e [archaeon]
MTKSKTKIDKQIRRKTNQELKQIVITMKKQNKIDLASLLSFPRRKNITVNIGRLARETKEGDKIIVPGKVLGSGDINHKITIAAVSFSSDAKNKLKNCLVKSIEEMAKEKDARILK